MDFIRALGGVLLRGRLSLMWLKLIVFLLSGDFALRSGWVVNGSWSAQRVDCAGREKKQGREIVPILCAYVVSPQASKEEVDDLPIFSAAPVAAHSGGSMPGKMLFLVAWHASCFILVSGSALHRSALKYTAKRLRGFI